MCGLFAHRLLRSRRALPLERLPQRLADGRTPSTSASKRSCSKPREPPGSPDSLHRSAVAGAVAAAPPPRAPARGRLSTGRSSSSVASARATRASWSRATRLRKLSKSAASSASRRYSSRCASARRERGGDSGGTSRFPRASSPYRLSDRRLRRLLRDRLGGSLAVTTASPSRPRR